MYTARTPDHFRGKRRRLRICQEDAKKRLTLAITTNRYLS